MATDKGSIRSPRKIYEIKTIKVKDKNKKEVSAIIRIKESIADILGLKPIAWNDKIFTGKNSKGKEYRRTRIGGFRYATYTIIANTQFEVEELAIDNKTGAVKKNKRKVRTIGIGCPTGVSATEFTNWIMKTKIAAQIGAIRTPAGTSFSVDVSTN